MTGDGGAGTVDHLAGIEAVELHRARLPLVRPLVAAHGTLHHRDLLFVRVRTSGGDGWGECGALPETSYTDEHLDAAEAFLRDVVAPALTDGRLPSDGELAAHPMAAAAARAAVLDARLRSAGASLAEHLGTVADRVAAGATMGVPGSPEEAAERAGALVDAGYRRLRVKVVPGSDVDVLTAVRRRVGDAVTLLADANQSYAALTVDEVVDRLRPLEELGLAALEQPLDAADVLGHAELAARLDVPLGLDESVTSLDALRRILDLRAAEVICVKPVHLGGYDQARAAHDLCRDAGVRAFVGGMFDSALARSANAALAALPGFDLPGDVGPPSVYLAADVADYPALAADGTVAVWPGPGIGPVPTL